MDQFQTLKGNYFDICVCGSFALAAYPLFLVFGTPELINRKVSFVQNSYIKINPANYDNFFIGLKKATEFIVTEQICEYQPLFDTLHCAYFFKVENGHLFLKQENKQLSSSNLFQLNIAELTELQKAFAQLLFLPYCYPYYVHNAFKKFLSQERSLSDFANLNSQGALELAKTLTEMKKHEYVHYIKDCLLRHKNELIIAYELKAYPEAPNLALNKVLNSN